MRAKQNPLPISRSLDFPISRLHARGRARRRGLPSVLISSTFVLYMRTDAPAPLAETLFGRTRTALLGLLLAHPDEWLHLRQIARESGTSAGTAHRELQVLVNLGLLLREPGPTAVRFKANAGHPVFPELKNLFAKTSGASELLRAGLEKLGATVELAFIYGSVARGEERAGSDIDLLVIGPASLADVLKAIRPALETLRREVNPAVYSRAEFARKAAEGHSFIQRVLQEPKIFLKGDARELGQPGEDRKAAPPRSAPRRNPATSARPRPKPRRRSSRRAQQ